MCFVKYFGDILDKIKRKKNFKIISFFLIIVIFLIPLSFIIPSFFPIYYNEEPILNKWINGEKNSENITVAQYWNNDSWVTILGLDDCSNVSDAIDYYNAIGVKNVPTIAYLYNYNGNVNDLLSSDSEIGLHYPHNWQSTLNESLTNSIKTANQGKEFIDKIPFASRYGKIISMAEPGNTASLALLEAEWSIVGIRIDGMGSNLDNKFIGAYWPNASYQPENPFDLMNLCREINLDNVNYNLYSMENYTIANNGVLVFYAHQWFPCNNTNNINFMVQLNNTKTQWKSNQGELASYIFGEKSLNIIGNNVSRLNPTIEGYWNVPITVNVALHGKTVKDILLNNKSILDDKIDSQIMQCGYSISNDTLHISEYWNTTTEIKVI